MAMAAQPTMAAMTPESILLEKAQNPPPGSVVAT